MDKTYKVSDRELVKWTKILGARKMIDLYAYAKIYLTSAQLDMVIAVENNPKKKGVVFDEFIAKGKNGSK